MAAAAAASENLQKQASSLFSQLKYEHLVAGISGGVLSTMVLHPLDLIKIRFQGGTSISFIDGPKSHLNTLSKLNTTIKLLSTLQVHCEPFSLKKGPNITFCIHFDF